MRVCIASAFQLWLDQDVVYIITPEERVAFLGLSTDEERNHFIEQFWQRRDPTPGTPENEYKDEHYRRIAYANEHFASSLPLPRGAGWRTARGRIYIQYGPPDEIESHPAGTYHRPDGALEPSALEVWLYSYIAGVGNQVFFQFADPQGTGEFLRVR
jgi:GWxTD domain-containing protein